MIERSTMVVGGGLLTIGIVFLALCVGGLGIPYMASMWGGLFGYSLDISWWLGAGIQLILGMFVWRNSTGILLGLIIITWFCELGGLFSKVVM